MTRRITARKAHHVPNPTDGGAAQHLLDMLGLEVAE